MFSTPKYLAVFFATVNSLYSSTSNPTENVFILAARDLDAGEISLIKEKKLNVWTIEKIREIGLNNTLDEFLDKLSKTKVKNLHFSFDIDCLDPEYVPGTGTPVEMGLTVEEGKQIISTILKTNLVKCLDFVEFNPDLDKNNKTLETCIELLNHISNTL